MDDDIDIIAHAETTFSSSFALRISIHPLFPSVPLGYQNRWRLIVSRGRRLHRVSRRVDFRRSGIWIGDEAESNAIALTAQTRAEIGRGEKKRMN